MYNITVLPDNTDQLEEIASISYDAFSNFFANKGGGVQLTDVKVIVIENFNTNANQDNSYIDDGNDELTLPITVFKIIMSANIGTSSGGMDLQSIVSDNVEDITDAFTAQMRQEFDPYITKTLLFVHSPSTTPTQVPTVDQTSAATSISQAGLAGVSAAAAAAAAVSSPL